MNLYTKSALKQIKLALDSVSTMINQLKEEDLHIKALATKRSIGELLEHISVLCEADLLILNGATEGEMSSFYNAHSYKTLEGLQQALEKHYKILEKAFLNYTENELLEMTTSYWGVTYSRYEWLLEIIAHLYHHRGQLHSLLVYHFKKDLNVSLFQ
ncbi:DinB family protein [Metabacillus litoralis]|uniref:DinB family protein n=1 Tax=Metabacillus litoralis TaxID=152268 RepID=UPI000EF5CAB7|nr:DinB family protein [Metabacillus litoralis]